MASDIPPVSLVAQPGTAPKLGGAESATAPQISLPQLLQHLTSEIMALRKEVSSDLSPGLTEAGKTLRSIDAFVSVALASRLTSELGQEIAKRFEEERTATRLSQRRRRFLFQLLFLLLLALLAAEISSDAVSLFGHQTLDFISATVSQHVGG